MDRVRERDWYLHYSLKTENACTYWVRFLIRWHNLKHPRDMGSADLVAFLGMLATQRKVATYTRNQTGVTFR
ncbi:phage integrase N-terminal SAM-like domain-containing protein [Caenimonas sp. SL110]|uniref:phage integrase N-terminal SAM-like domain-containing protein n=1 Tax=Caenimonas sp. SL110 TaxID=1450524 RepID=UPI002100D613|nr:phage integrase N-terminal SAM-like domain-containing protein [Caenimonas sp. SL110]